MVLEQPMFIFPVLDFNKRAMRAHVGEYRQKEMYMSCALGRLPDSVASYISDKLSRTHLNHLSPPPPLPFKWCQNACFCSFAPLSLLWGKEVNCFVLHVWCPRFNLKPNKWTISLMPKWCVFAPLCLHHCFGGKGVNCSILFCPRL